nr:reverse transcriptase domain-containing protein [Tanacetum cinerariifolium]
MQNDGSDTEPTTPNQSPSLQDQILNHVSSLETLIMQHNEKSGMLITPIRLTFREEVDTNRGNEKGERSHLLLRGGCQSREWEILVWCRMFQQTFDGPARGWFDRMPNGSIDRWSDLREKFVARFALRRRCSKDPTKVTKIVRKANKSLPDFKERWTKEMRYIQGVPEVMQISDFMSNSKFQKKGQGVPYKGFRPPRAIQGGGPPRGEGYNAYNQRDHYMPYVPPRQIGQTYNNRRFEHRRQEVNQLGLESLVKRLKEILATELQLQLPPPSSLIGTPKKENMDRYYDYHGEKGHYTNDCFQLKRQLEIALESQPQNHSEVYRVEASSPYNIIFGRTGMRELRTVSSITHAMMKFPTQRGISMLVPRKDAIFKCRQIDVRQASLEEPPEEKTGDKKEGLTKDIMINPAFPDQKITDGTQFYLACQNKLIELLKDNNDVFAWQPPDMVGILRRISQHTLNVNPSITPVAQKQRTLGQEKSKVVTKEVEEWLRSRISRTKKYMIMDVMKTFDNLKKINMKLNPKKCSFGVKEGKFLGYMVTLEGIRANLKKTKAVADMQSPKTLKEMQSLSGKLAGLNRFLSRSAERAMPFFDTLKNITKENKDDFQFGPEFAPGARLTRAVTEDSKKVTRKSDMAILNLEERAGMASRTAAQFSKEEVALGLQISIWNFAFFVSTHDSKTVCFARSYCRWL